MSRTGRDLPPRAAVVIIGGGVIGVSTAYQLAAAGVTDVVLVDTGAFGSGSTCKAAGGVRAQFSDRVNIELGRAQPADVRALRASSSARRSTCTRSGYLFLLDSPDARRRRSSGTSRSRTSSACPAGCISVGRGRALSPLIGTDGLARRRLLAHRRALHARSRWCSGTPPRPAAHGARLMPHCAGHRHRDRGRPDRRRRRPRAAGSRPTPSSARPGAWSARGRRVGGRRPAGDAAAPPDPGHRADPRARPGDAVHDRLRHQLLLPPRRPRPAAGHVRPARRPPGSSWTGPTPGCPASARPWSAVPPPSLDVGIASGWAGLYEMTPDHNALIGEAALGQPVPLRHRLLRPRLPDGPGRRRGHARPLPRPPARASTSAASTRAASPRTGTRPELNIV